MNKRWLLGLLAALVVGTVGFLLWRIRVEHEIPQDADRVSAAHSTNAPGNDSTQVAKTPSLSSLDAKVERLKQEASESFDKIIARLPLYGELGEEKDRKIVSVQRTNRNGGINVEVGVRLGSYHASFSCGPLDTNGMHTNPFLPDGALLTQFYSLYDGSDTRRKPEAAKEWYRSTGKWSEQEALEQTLRLAQALGHQTNLVARHQVTAVPLTLKDPSGVPVVTTPFYKVDLYKADDDALVLGVEYRIGDAPPGKVTRWFNWPPVKVP